MTQSANGGWTPDASSGRRAGAGKAMDEPAEGATRDHALRRFAHSPAALFLRLLRLRLGLRRRGGRGVSILAARPHADHPPSASGAIGVRRARDVDHAGLLDVVFAFGAFGEPIEDRVLEALLGHVELRAANFAARNPTLRFVWQAIFRRAARAGTADPVAHLKHLSRSRPVSS